MNNCIALLEKPTRGSSVCPGLLYRPAVICLLSICVAFAAYSQSDPPDNQRPDFPWEFVKVAELDTGSDEALLGYQRYGTATIGPDGAVFIVTDAWDGVHEFYPSGRWRRNLGGEGNGPGEFQRVRYIDASPTGRLAIYDRVVMRISFLERNGAFSSSFGYNIDDTSMSRIAFAGDEQLWVFTGSPDQRLTPGIRREDLVLLSAGGDTLNIYSVPDSEPYLVIEHEGHPLLSTYNPKVGALKWTVSPDGTAWLFTPGGEHLICISSETGESDTLAVQYSATVFTNEQWAQLMRGWTSWTREAEAVGNEDLRPAIKTIRKMRTSFSPIQQMWWIDECGLLVDRVPDLIYPTDRRSSLLKYAAILRDGSMTKEVEGPPGIITAGYGYALQRGMSDSLGLPNLTLWKLVPTGG